MAFRGIQKQAKAERNEKESNYPNSIKLLSTITDLLLAKWYKST